MNRSRWRICIAVLCLGGLLHGRQIAVADEQPLYTNPPRDAITMFGHACCYIDLNGFVIVTDPVFDRSYSLFHNRRIPAPPDSLFAHTSIVLISHAHRDHLSPKTLARFPETTTILCPPPSAEKLSDLDRSVRTVAPGDSIPFPGGVIFPVSAHHAGGRYSLNAGADGRALGYIIRTPQITLYYSGDTEFFDGLRDIGATYRPELALLNINSHLNGSDAVRAVFALGLKKVIPNHFGAYGPRPGRERRWRRELRDLLGSIVVPVAVGQSYALPKPPEAADPSECDTEPVPAEFYHRPTLHGVDAGYR